MFVKIGNTVYSTISNLSFAPQTDLTGTTIPVNEFEVDIITSDNIREGVDASLYDDRNNLWATYWVTYVRRISQNTVRMRAQSRIVLLERRTINAALIENVLASDLLTTIFAGFPAGSWELDSSFSGVTLDGYHPEMTARDLLLWTCFAIGAYVKTYFTDKIEILPIDHQTTPWIPANKTFYKPSFDYSEYVTAIKIKAFSFTEGTPQATDEWVQDNDGTYIVTEQVYTLANPSASPTAPENVMQIDDVMFVNSSNADDILSRIGRYYFNRTEVDLDCINNAEFMPGQRVTAYQDEDVMVKGYITQCTFSFGLQARSSIKLIAIDTVASGKLIILYKYNGTQIGRRVYSFPVGYTYTIQNPYIDLNLNNHRYVYRPLNASATGTIAAGENTNVQNCDVALDLDRPTGVLHVISVDSVTVQTGDVVIGVIA